MNDNNLRLKMAPVLRRLRWEAAAKQVAVSLAAAALVGLALSGFQSLFTLAIPRLGAALAIASAAGFAYRQARRPAPDWSDAARRLEREFPELDGLVLTAAEQKPSAGGGLTYLQRRLIDKAGDHGVRNDWLRAAPLGRFGWTTAASLALAAITLLSWQRTGVSRAASVANRVRGVEVTPGDTTIERGSSLVVLARFGDPLPAVVHLVISTVGTSAQTQPLARSLEDPVFGGSVPNVVQDFTYRLEYAGRATREYTVRVFEHPRLERADATLTYPAYTGLSPKRIPDTRRVTAVEGTRLDLAFQLNKAVASASLRLRGNSAPPIPLTIESNRAAASLKQFNLATSAAYELRLVDAEGRTNKIPASFVFEAQPNRRPELRITAPTGDVRPAPLDEIPFAGSVWDDFGSPGYGIAFTVSGRDTQYVELGGETTAQEKRSFQHLLRLEDLAVHAGQLISWFAWADDIGPDGQRRRTKTDLYFAEVRPFDEVFREGQSQEAQSGQQDQQGGQGGATAKLAELERQILSATWKLSQDPAQNPAKPFRDDVEVVHESQDQALKQAQEQLEKAANPQSQALWTAIVKPMTEASKQLREAGAKPVALTPALAAEQAAAQALLALEARERSVSRARRSSRGQGQGQQASQRQTDQLDLAQSERPYETKRQATPSISGEQRERLQALSRLQELARRQQDLNERLAEMQTALREARTSAERDDRQRELKRLEEQQRQMLSDVDELRQRMDRPENQSAMTNERQRLDEARDQIQQAADAANQGATGRAMAAGNRAQRQLQQLRDDFRRQSSRQFSDEVRDLRAAARELTQNQENVGKQLQALDQPGRRTLGDSGGKQALLDQMKRQDAALTNLLDHAAQLSEQAEAAEPLLSERLNDAVREFTQKDSGAVKGLESDLARRGLLTRGLNRRLEELDGQDGPKSLRAAEEMVKNGLPAQAVEAGNRARAGLDTLKQGVERAAEGILGDDTESLRQAAQALDAAAADLENEMARRSSTNRPSGRGEQAQRDAGSAGGRGQSPEGGSSRQVASAGAQAPGGRPGQSPDGQSGQTRGSRQGGGRSGNAPGGAGGQGQVDQPTQSGSPGGQSESGGGARVGLARGGRGGRTHDGGASLGGGGAEGGGGGSGRDSTDLGIGNVGRSLGPITGENFGPWSDRLRDVEQMVDPSDLRNQVATARERARLMRLEFIKHGDKPDWARVELQILKPLVEARARIADELARRTSKEALAPIDRDPTPAQYAELVRHYFERMGKDR